MTTTDMNMTELIQPNVMAQNAIIPTPSNQATTANEAPAINSKLRRWVVFVEQIKNETIPDHQYHQVAPFIKDADEIRKARANKRLDAKLRKLEVEQKATLLAEVQKSIQEARRKFESQPQVPYDYTPRPPSSINDLFRQDRPREELIALEREQKEELLRQVMEKRARECGEQWPQMHEMSQDPRFDHIPKHGPGYKQIIEKAFPLASPIKSQEPNE